MPSVPAGESVAKDSAVMTGVDGDPSFRSGRSLCKEDRGVFAADLESLAGRLGVFSVLSGLSSAETLILG